MCRVRYGSTHGKCPMEKSAPLCQSPLIDYWVCKCKQCIFGGLHVPGCGLLSRRRVSQLLNTALKAYHPLCASRGGDNCKQFALCVIAFTTRQVTEIVVLNHTRANVSNPSLPQFVKKASASFMHAIRPLALVFCSFRSWVASLLLLQVWGLFRRHRTVMLTKW